MHKLRLALVFLIAVSLVGCSTTRYVEVTANTDPTDQDATIKVGDFVRVRHQSGGVYSFHIEELTESMISGDGNQIARSSVVDIVKVERAVSGKKTFGAVGIFLGVISVAAVMVLVNALKQLSDDSKD